VIQRAERKVAVANAVQQIDLPAGFSIRPWTAESITTIQELSSAEGWPTPSSRSAETLAAWNASWPAIVLTQNEKVIGFLRALSDGHLTTYISEVLVASSYRGLGLGAALVETCHLLCRDARIDLLSTGSADGFYKAKGFRPFQGFRKSYGVSFIQP
jgi:GNAT superfamily N-acetyltransferase